MTQPLLDPDTDDTVRLSVGEAQALAERALAKLGFTAGDAVLVANHLIDAALWGFGFTGLPRILMMAKMPEMKRPCTPITVVKETPVSALVDGGNQVGYITLERVTDIAIEKARTSGIALVGLRNSWYGGRNGYYLERIARAGLAAIHFGSSAPTVVPPGAMRKALGTNPIAIAIPGKDDPFILDMGTSVVMLGEVILKASQDESFSEVVGVNKAGLPTAVGRELLEGGVFPFGGHKGYGLSLAVQMFGLMAGAKHRGGNLSDFGFLMVAFDPELLMPLDQFTAELAELQAMVTGLPRQPGVSEIRMPSERGFREREIRRRQGLVVERQVVDELRAL